MRRRDLLALAGGAAAAWPLGVRAQHPGRTYRIGHITVASRSDPGSGSIFESLVRAMREEGFVEGANLVIVERSGHGKEAVFPAFAAELVAMKVDLILAVGASATFAAKHATRTIPIVMALVTNPERLGLVTSLARPGGNITGLSNVGAEYTAKHLEFIKEAMPARNRVGVLWNPDSAGAVFSLRQTQMPVARTLGIELIPIELRSAADLDRGFDIAVRERTQVLLAHLGVWPHRARILAFAQRNELPLVASTRELAPLGALITYGPDVRAHLRRAASYVVRILRGMHPGELPIEQPDKFELVINLKTAKVLGITIPPSLLARADEVIE